MSYITDTDIERRLGTAAYIQLTDDAGTGAVDSSVVGAARDGAVGEVNSFLARRFRVPIDLNAHPELAAILATVTLDVVAHRLHARRPPVPVEVGKRYESTVSWLSDVASGEVVLPAMSALALVATTGVIAKTHGNPAILSREELKGL